MLLLAIAAACVLTGGWLRMLLGPLPLHADSPSWHVYGYFLLGGLVMGWMLAAWLWAAALAWGVP